MKEVKCEGQQATVVQRAAENNFKSVLFAIINCSETASIAREIFKTKIVPDCRNYAKQRSTSFFCSIAAINKGVAKGGSWRARDPHFCKPFSTKQPTTGGENAMTISWPW